MTLYLETPGGFVPWAGEAIEDILHPISIETLWSAEDLAAIGLFSPAAAAPVPEGKISTGTIVVRVAGVVRFIHQLMDALPGSPPLEISDRQFFQKLAIAGVITEAEALAAVQTGTIPAVMAGIVENIDHGDQFAAQMLLSGATTFRRDHPLVVIFADALTWTSDDVDEFWRAAAAL